MADHYSPIGFRFDSRQDFGKAMAELFVASKEQRSAGRDRTSLWTDGSAEVWFHPDADWCIVPGFTATTRIPVTPKEWIEDDAGCPYCSILSVEVLGEGGDLLYPLAVTFGDVKVAREAIRLGESCDITLAAFAESGKSWADMEEYRVGGDWPIGPRWLMPLGPFSAVDGLRDNSPRAMIYGIVRSVQFLRNSWTGIEYRHAALESYGPAPFDVLIANNTLPDIQVGSVVAVQSWLCASYVFQQT